MKRLIFIIAIVLFRAYFPADGASYLIHLKNGSELLTNWYWEEGDQLMFYFSGGIVGIQKDFINNIKESNLVYREKDMKAQAPQAPVDQKSRIIEEGQSKKSEKDNSGAEKVDFDYYKQKRREFLEKLDEAQERYEEVLKTKDPQASEHARQEWVSFGTKIHQLADELKKKNKGVLPDWWDNWER